MKLLFIIGTRPEAIKLAPVINLARCSKEYSVIVCNTGQHREMIEQALDIFDIQCDYNLNVMKKSKGVLSKLSAYIMLELNDIIEREKPDWVLVQGDTVSAFAGGLVGFYNNCKVAHIEAGLRSHDNYHPFPEEVNRKLISTFAQLHFAPTAHAKECLMREAISPKKIINSGNTVIDALLITKTEIKGNLKLRNFLKKSLSFLDSSKKIILLTAHRRENHQNGLENICRAVNHIAEMRKDVQIIFPVHLNPKVKQTVSHHLSNGDNIILTDPLDYYSIVYLLERCYLVLTDSGGLQEEASAFSKPVLVLRNKTERMEGVLAGLSKLIGTNCNVIIEQVCSLLDNKKLYDDMSSAVSPYGAGKSAQVILDCLSKYVGGDEIVSTQEKIFKALDFSEYEPSS